MPPIATDRILAETFIARVEHHPTLGSTNDRAREAAQTPGPTPLLVLADEQTAGRGRGANRWWTGRGSLAFSLLLSAQQAGAAAPQQSPLVALAAGVAVVDAVAPLVPDEPLGIHWPNDVMVGRRKLAGILVEVLPDRWHVLGIGVNSNNTLADAPPELRDSAVTLRDLTGREHDHTAFLIGLLSKLEGALKQLAAQPTRVAARASVLCLQIGRDVTFRSGNRETTGRCLGIAADGALVLDTPQGQQALYSGVLQK